VFKGLFLPGFWVLYTHYLSLPMRATCIVNLILPDFITPLISGEEYKLCSSSFYNFLKTTASQHYKISFNTSCGYVSLHDRDAGSWKPHVISMEYPRSVFECSPNSLNKNGAFIKTRPPNQV
jgi:hypothetical protein